MKQVSIVQRRMTHYRLPLFIILRKSLEEKGIKLNIFFGDGRKCEDLKEDAGKLEWAFHLKTSYFFNERVCYQPFLKKTQNDDLTIITEENCLVCNFAALYGSHNRKIAYWGHGGNFQSNPQSLKEKFKSQMRIKSDWYFGYTNLTKKKLDQSGYDLNKVTILNNSIDNQDLENKISSITSDEILNFKKEYSIGDGPVGIFIGSLYSFKRIDFLLESITEIVKRVRNFQVIIIGDGDERSKITSFAINNPSVIYLGSKHGKEKAIALKISSIMLNPGLVGLGVIDSFVSRVPILSTECQLHSPEIVYLDSSNSIVCQDDLDTYVNECVSFIRNKDLQDTLKLGCSIAANKYTLKNMVKNFTQGIVHALGSQS